MVAIWKVSWHDDLAASPLTEVIGKSSMYQWTIRDGDRHIFFHDPKAAALMIRCLLLALPCPSVSKEEAESLMSSDSARLCHDRACEVQSSLAPSLFPQVSALARRLEHHDQAQHLAKQGLLHHFNPIQQHHLHMAIACDAMAVVSEQRAIGNGY